MRTHAGAILVTSLLGVLAARPALANASGGYFDLLSPEVVSESGSKTYDLNQTFGTGSDSRSVFLGNTIVKGGTFYGAGFGMRGLLHMENGVVLGFEGMVAGGRIKGADLPWASQSVATHMDVLFTVGYGVDLGPLMIHGAVVFGGDYMSFDVAGPTNGREPLSSAMMGVDPSMGALSLSRWDLRAGLQAGAHIQLADGVGIFGDGTYDYDGQWRFRVGLAFGKSRHD